MVTNEQPLADLFLIFGVNKSQLSSSTIRSLRVELHKDSLYSLEPTILDSYPKNPAPADQAYMDNLLQVPLYPFHPFQICFPERFRVEEVNETNITIRFKITHFTLTPAHGLHKYVTSLSFSEVSNLKEENDMLADLDPILHAVPKAFCLISSMPVFDLHKYH